MHGKVATIFIPRPGDDEKDGSKVAKSSIGKIFVEFETKEGAQQAATKLGGRSFNKKLVGASFYDEAKYADKDVE